MSIFKILKASHVQLCCVQFIKQPAIYSDLCDASLVLSCGYDFSFSYTLYIGTAVNTAVFLRLWTKRTVWLWLVSWLRCVQH